MSEQSMITFIINSSTYTLPRSRRNLNKIPDDKEDIYNQLITDRPYHVQSSVPNEIFQSFLDYWQTSTIPQINFSNSWHYYSLNEEFGIMKELLSLPEYQSLFDLGILANMNQNNNLNRANIERRIALNLESYLINQSDNLSRIPIYSLYNIFYHPERNLTDYDRAYHFIVDNGNNLNDNFFILLGSLDAEKFNLQENKRDAFVGRKDHKGFEPQNANSFVSNIEQQLQDCRNQINQQQNSLNESNQRKNQLEAELRNANQLNDRQNSQNEARIRELQLTYNRNLSEKDEQIRVLTQEVRELHTQNNQNEARIRELQLTYNRNLSEKDEQIRVLTQEVRELHTQNVHNEARIRELNDEISKFVSVIRDLISISDVEQDKRPNIKSIVLPIAAELGNYEVVKQLSTVSKIDFQFTRDIYCTINIRNACNVTL